MEALREGIGLRGYGQKDPKQEYKKEGFVIFGEMMGGIGRNVCEKLFHMQVQRDESARVPVVSGRQRGGGSPSRGAPAKAAAHRRIGRWRRAARRERRRRQWRCG